MNIIKKISITLICLFLSLSTYSSQFEELDKPPEGAHEGQILVGGFISLGIPFGDIIDGEKKFVKNNTYTFTESEITKELLVTHLSYDFGASFEYMPVDYVGIKSKLKRVIVVQRTLFGSDFQNWNETVYSNFSFLAGPSFHLTNRIQWDVTFTPVIGYALAKYHTTPIAAELISGYSGDRNRTVSGLTYGSELNLTVYLSGGLFISLGTDWNIYPLKFNPSYNLTNPDNSEKMNKGSGNLQTINFALSAGYAFSN